jgi:ACS family allantoate permease-like MFS transporter
VTASLMLITGMFYTRVEIGERIGWCVFSLSLPSPLTNGVAFDRTFQCNGFAQIVSGFIAFGVYHANPKAHPNQWQWLMITIALMTFITGPSSLSRERNMCG